MGVLSEPHAPNRSGLVGLLAQIQSENGLTVMLLVGLVGFGCFLFWSLIWRVWSAAMKAKDDEIARLAKERDRYQTLVFQRLRSSQVPDGQTLQKRARSKSGIDGNPN